MQSVIRSVSAARRVVAHLDHGGLALPGEGGGLLLPDAGALGLVEDEGWRAVVDVGVAVHAVVVSAMETHEVSPGLCCHDHHTIILVAHFRVLVVEEAVSSVAASV